MFRFYTPDENFQSSHIFLKDKAEAHHLTHVLRLKPGDQAVFFNGKNAEALGLIESAGSQEITVKILTHTTIPELTPKMILACAMPKKTKMDTIIEKATELGADEILPMQTDRTEIVLKEKTRKEKRQKRFEAIAISACKQSRRANIPVIHPVLSFPEAINELKKRSLMILPSLSERPESLPETLKKHQKKGCFSFFIGPEGDFSPEEYALAAESGCIPVTLGKTVLRVETAAISVLSFANIYLRS